LSSWSNQDELADQDIIYVEQKVANLITFGNSCKAVFGSPEIFTSVSTVNAGILDINDLVLVYSTVKTLLSKLPTMPLPLALTKAR
jgi:hypothetical protein